MGCNAEDGGCGCSSCKVGGPCGGGAKPPVNPACVIGTVPCPAETHSRACLPGDPALSTTVICRRALGQGLWARQLIMAATIPAGSYTELNAIFPAFVAAGKLCVTSVTLTITTVGPPPVATAVAVQAVGASAVWDFVDSPGSPLWTPRVSDPCMHEVLSINTTTGRCPCDAACADCLYPAAIGGLFAVRLRFPSITLLATDTVTLDVTGTYAAKKPCCQIPLAAGEPAVVAGPYPALQSIV